MIKYLADRKMGFLSLISAWCAFSMLVAFAGCGRLQGLNDELLQAAKNGDAVSVQNFLNKGADVNARDEWMNTSLSWAVLGDHYSSAMLLIEAGANINDVSFKGLSPLHLATINGNAKMVKLLLANGADVNAKDNHRSTVLMNAINMGETAIVQTLLESGADVHAKNDQGQSSLFLAKKFDEKEMIRKLKYFGAIAGEEIISGNIQKTKQGIVLSMEDGDIYVIKGKDLSEMVGQSVIVTGTLTEGGSGKILTVSSVLPISGGGQIMIHSDDERVEPIEE